MVLIVLAAAIVLGVVFQSTSPNESNLSVILLAFICIYIIFVGVCSFLIKALSWTHTTLRSKVSNQATYITTGRSYYYGSILAFAPTALLAFSSVGALGVYEFALVGTLVLIGMFYVKKRS